MVLGMVWGDRDGDYPSGHFLLLESGSLYIALAILNSLCLPGWPHVHRDTPASDFWVLGLKACATTSGCSSSLKRKASTTGACGETAVS